MREKRRRRKVQVFRNTILLWAVGFLRRTRTVKLGGVEGRWAGAGIFSFFAHTLAITSLSCLAGTASMMIPSSTGSSGAQTRPLALL